MSLSALTLVDILGGVFVLGLLLAMRALEAFLARTRVRGGEERVGMADASVQADAGHLAAGDRGRSRSEMDRRSSHRGDPSRV